MEKQRYEWVTRGDINAFFGLLLDNVAGLFLILSILSGVFQIPGEFVIKHMIPGTAIGVFIGDLWFFFMAFRLAKITGKPTVTAMPLGLDTPSVFGITFFVLGPAYKNALASGLSVEAAATQTWHIGIFCMVASGLLKFGCSFIGQKMRDTIPRAGLLGSLTAIALVVISFLPLLDIMLIPAVGMLALAIILVSLLGHVPMPWKLPGSVVALFVSGLIYYIMWGLNLLPVEAPQAMPDDVGFYRMVISVDFRMAQRLEASCSILAHSLTTGSCNRHWGIDCTESAAAVGDEYKTNHVIGVEAFATIAAGCMGGVIQTTPYIGHPAYKAMGGRAAYSLGTAVCMLVIGLLGLFTLLLHVHSESGRLSAARVRWFGDYIAKLLSHATSALSCGCICLRAGSSFLSVHFVKQIMGHPAIANAGVTIDSLGGELSHNLNTAILLSNGFIMVSLVWSTALSFAIDRRLKATAVVFAIGALMTLFGIIHSPRPDAGCFCRPLANRFLKRGDYWTLHKQSTCWAC